ncbi:VWA domain-containing protein [Streptomyces sp. NPDC102360]|uniref:VWA domain-containing protein n=1 Tax=Streptomyces sp. NPDC102360 TaxID=3366160 RepID=UPI00380071D3
MNAPGTARAVVAADRFDRLTWRDTYEQAAGVRELASELAAGHECAEDLLADVFLAAYTSRVQVRERPEMARSRLLNHEFVSALVESPEFAEVRRDTVGDPYAAAMALLAQGSALRGLLEREAQDRTGETVRRDGKGAAAATAGTPGAPGAPGAPGTPGIRAAARSAAAKASRAVRQDAALTRAWGVGSGELERMSFEERARLAERLRSGRLAEWAELIGRFREMAAGERARKVENATGELVGVTLGDDLSRLVPSELAGLGVPALRAVFAARYAAGELMLYDSRGEQPTGRGAVIACVDTSHSMYEAGPGGVTREVWAKACALALLDQARAAGRDFVGILFSAADKVRVFRFPADRPAALDATLEFAETFLGGGTSYQAPLGAARDLLEREFDDAARARGDIVLLTDDDCGVTEEWMRGWNAAKHRLGFRVFGVAVGAPPAAESDSVLDALCDNLRSVEDFTDVHAAADLFRVI